MSHARLIAFDRPLAGVALRGQGGRPCTEAELAEHAQAAYRRGVDAARALADQQMVEFRADIGQLSDGILQKLSSLEGLLVSQLRSELPGLAVEIARRLLAGYEPAPEVVAKLCTEALDELFPERENLELVVSPRDAAPARKAAPRMGSPLSFAAHPRRRRVSPRAIARCAAASASPTRAWPPSWTALTNSLTAA